MSELSVDARVEAEASGTADHVTDLSAFGVTIRSRGAAEKSKADWKSFPSSGTQAITVNETVSIRALVAYIASMSKRPEFTVERLFCDHFGIPNIKCLPSQDYDRAIRYLVETAP